MSQVSLIKTEECSICYGPIIKEQMATTACNHTFCVKCIHDWLDKQNSINNAAAGATSVATTSDTASAISTATAAVTASKTATPASSCPICRAPLNKDDLKINTTLCANTLKTFPLLKGVVKQDYGYHLLLDSNNKWIPNLDAVLSVLKWKLRKSKTEISASDMQMTLEGEPIIFETPAAKCSYSSTAHQLPGCFRFSSEKNPELFSLLEELNTVFGNFFRTTERLFKYKSLIYENDWHGKYIKFPLLHHQKPSQADIATEFTNSMKEKSYDIYDALENASYDSLDDKAKYLCRFIFSISFSKLTSINCIYPNIQLKYVKCDKLPKKPVYTFLMN